MGEVLGSVATLIVGIATVFFAHNYRRQISLQTAQRRIDAYGALWTAMHAARPTRTEIKGEVISEQERHDLEEQMSAWYFNQGHGMLLTQAARQMYFATKANLVADLDDLQPAIARERIKVQATDAKREWERGKLSIRQLSLLRTQMKADLDIYGRLYGKLPDDEDKAFIRYCKLNPNRRPWRPSQLKRLRGRVERLLERRKGDFDVVPEGRGVDRRAVVGPDVET
jgi:hypothetical protein